MASPQWAIDLVELVAREAGQPPPALTWRRSGKTRVTYARGALVWAKPTSSSGRFMIGENRIIVTAGRIKSDQKIVLLHECAHWLTPAHHHDSVFWDKAWELYFRHKLPIREVKRREFRYRVEAEAAYKRAKKGIDNHTRVA